MHTELFMRCIVKILWSLKCVRIDLNDLKTVISISVTKNTPNTLQLWKITNCRKKKLWKILKLIDIVLIFLL